MEYIKGKIKNTYENYVILESNNIGYKIIIADNNFFSPEKIYKIFIFDKYSFVNSTINLKKYGFLSYKEKNLFEKIIGINGIGPKNAMNILKINYDQIISNISNCNYDFFIIENKINKRITELLIKNININDKFNIKKISDTELENKSNLINSLEYLGFPINKINKIILNMNLEEPLEDLIRKSIKEISNIEEK